MSVAHDDFHRHLIEKSGGPNKEFSDYMSRIENYNFKVAAGPARLVVWISPRMSDDYPVIFGGAASTFWKLRPSRYWIPDCARIRTVAI
jgi:hypothetical protein